MFNLIKDKLKNNKTYDDISKVYNILDITDNHIIIKENNILKQIHIFKVIPVTIININDSLANNIINTYKEFLRSMNIDFQIIIENTEVNINNYFDNIVVNSKNDNRSLLAKIYKSEMVEMLNQNNIYIQEYYIVISVDEKVNINEIINNIYGLSKIGVIAEKIKGEDKLNNFIYSKINKVNSIC